MMIEITGGHTANKGAQLMLLTATKALRSLNGDPEFCMSPLGSYIDRAGYGLWQLFPRRRYRRSWATPAKIALGRLVGSCMRRKTCDRYGLVRHQDTDALIDLSGSLFSDYWPVSQLANHAHLVADYKRRGKPVIFLPQMFGPFNTAASAKAFCRIASQADLVYARDLESLNHLRDIGGDRAAFGQAPDITIFNQPDTTDLAYADRGYACMVPNIRMLDHGDPRWAKRYVPYLVDAAKFMISQGLKVKLVVHDTKGKDRVLAEQILSQLNNDLCELISESDPLRLKALIGASRLIVASRYHSIVAALSMGVPAVVIGWSHKYQQLLNDFGAGHLCVDALEPIEGFCEKLASLFDQPQWDRCHETLGRHKASMAPINRQMWQDVAKVLGLMSPGGMDNS